MMPLPDTVIDRPNMREKIRVFDDRKHAGEILGAMLQSFQGSDAILFGIPAGGLPVAMVVSEKTGLELDVAVVSKITLPWNTEAGYGAVAFDGTVRLNESMLTHIRLSEEQILAGKEYTLDKVNRRIKILRGDRLFPDLAGRTAFLVDDGLASGFTLMAAIEAVKNAGAASISVAVPTGHMASIHRIVKQVDMVFCPNIRSGTRFAVADAYTHWSDVTDDELLELLKGLRESTNL